MSAGSILYLDFDGTLHRYVEDENGALTVRHPFEFASLLEEALQPYPHVRIVLSTDWVRTKGLDVACAALPVSLQQRVIGVTALGDDMPPRPTRYQQIAHDVAMRQPAAWLALDDDDRGWPTDQREHLAWCWWTMGIDEPRVRKTLDQWLRSI